MAPFFTGLAKGLGGYGFGRLSGGVLGPLFNAPEENTVIDGSVGYLVFTSPFSLDVSRTVSGAEVLVVGGGAPGRGDNNGGGGGGAGGIIHIADATIPQGTYTITVGTASNDSIFSGVGFAYTGFAGGFGQGNPGGSGGGIGYLWAPLPAVSQPTLSYPGGSSIQTPQTYPIGTGTGYGNPAGTLGPYQGGSGGGGAGAAGGTGGAPPNPEQNSGGPGGAGGAGQPFPQFPAPILAPAIPAPARPSWTPAVGPTGRFGGGGGGGAYPSPGSGGPGGVGGGGSGGSSPSGSPANPGVNFTGGGGGGTGQHNPPASGNGSGATGIVIIKYNI